MEGQREPYSKGKPLIPGLEGVTYQVAMLMKYALAAYQNGQQFELMTEAEEYEKFDDIVIHAGTTSTVIQVKHGHDEGSTYSLKDLAGNPADKGKKVQIAKYFDSWYRIKRRNLTQTIQCQLVTNYRVEQDLNFAEIAATLWQSVHTYSVCFRNIKLLGKLRFTFSQEVCNQAPSDFRHLINQCNTGAINCNRNKPWQAFLVNHIVYTDDNQALLHLPLSNNMLYQYAGLALALQPAIALPQVGTLQELIRTSIQEMYSFTDFQGKQWQGHYVLGKNLLYILSGCLVADDTKQGWYKLSEQFINGYKHTPLQKYLCKHILAALPLARQSLTPEEEIEFQQAYQEFTNQFSLVTAQKRVQELEKELQAEVCRHFGTVFPGHYEAFYLHILKWLRDENYKQTKGTIETIFQTIAARMPSQALVGITDNRMQRKLKTIPALYQNTSVKNKLEQFMNSGKTLAFVNGASKKANTVLVKNYLDTKQPAYISGQYIFVKANSIIDYSNPEYYLMIFLDEQLQVIILDDAAILLKEGHRHFLQQLIELSLRKQKKLILLTADSMMPDLKMFNIAAAHVEWIENPSLENAQIGIVRQCHPVSESFLLFGQIYSYQTVMNMVYTTLSKYFRNYDYLEQLLAIQMNTHGVNKPTVTMSYMPPMLYRLVPFYHLTRLLTHVSTQYTLIQISVPVTMVDQVRRALAESHLVKRLEADYPAVQDVTRLREDLTTAHDRPLVLDILSTPNEQLPNDLLQLLGLCKKLIILIPETMPIVDISLTLRLTVLTEPNQDIVCRIHSSQGTTLPKPEGNFKEEHGDYGKLLAKTSTRNQTVLLAKAGLGKSRLCFELRQRRQDNIKEDLKDYDFVFIIDVSLITDQRLLGSTYIETIINIIKAQFPYQLNKVEIAILKQSLLTNDILLTCDGLDMISVTQYAGAKLIFEHIFTYPHILATTRPDAHIPFIPTQTFNLTLFNIEQAREVINSYLRKKSLQYQFSEDDFKYAPRMAAILLTPLHCQLFCETLTEQKPSSEELNRATKLGLYQNFVLGKMRLFVRDRKKISKDQTENIHQLYTVGHRWLKRMMKVAYAQMNIEKLVVDVDEVLDVDINQIGLVDTTKTTSNLYEFFHPTAREYFAALYIAHGLCAKNRQERFYQLIKQSRYLTRYEVLLQFVAQILTEGDPLLPGNLTAGLNLFCQALLAPPRDLLGLRHVQMIRACFAGCDATKLVYQAGYLQQLLKGQAPATPLIIPPAPRQYTLPNVQPLALSEQSIYQCETDKFLGGFDQRSDYGKFNQAFLQLSRLKDASVCGKLIMFLLSTVIYPGFLQNKNVLIINNKETTWKNKCGVAVKIVISQIKYLSEQDEHQILEALFLLAAHSSSNALSTDLHDALRKYIPRFAYTAQFLVEQIENSSILHLVSTSIICLRNSRFFNMDLMVYILRKRIDAGSSLHFQIHAIGELIHLNYTDVVYIKKSVMNRMTTAGIEVGVIDIGQRSLVHFNVDELVLLLDKLLIAIRANTLNNYYLQQLFLLVEQIIERESSLRMHFKQHWVSQLADIKCRQFIFTLLLKHQMLDNNVVELLLAAAEDKAFTCGLLATLPSHLIDVRVVQFIFDHATSFALWSNLEKIIKDNKSLEIMYLHFRKTVLVCAARDMVDGYMAANIYLVVCKTNGPEQAAEVYINTIPRNAYVSVNTEIVANFSADALKKVWQNLIISFIKTGQLDIEQYWSFKLFSQYIIQQKLAITQSEKGFVVSFADKYIEFTFPSNLSSLQLQTLTQAVVGIFKKTRDYYFNNLEKNLEKSERDAEKKKWQTSKGALLALTTTFGRALNISPMDDLQRIQQIPDNARNPQTRERSNSH